MKNIELSSPAKNDLESMRGIWRTIFGCDDTDLFFDLFYSQDLCLVAKSKNMAVSMGHLLPVGDLVTLKTAPLPTAMIYAVATLPEYRKLGLGSAITENLIKLAQNAGYPAVVLCPAQDSLFDFYSSKTNMMEWFYASEYLLKPPFTKQSQARFAKIPLNEYIVLRNKLLQSIPHIRLNQRAIEYQKGLCELFGGGLYKINTPLGDSCAIIERQSSDLICVKELVMPRHAIDSCEYLEYIQDIAAAAISIAPALECIIRTPVVLSLPPAQNANLELNTKRFAMLSPPPQLQNFAATTDALPWYGLAFD